MGYKTSPTSCTVQLLALHALPPATLALCHALRQEAGRCWSDLVAAHRAAREQGVWLTDAELRALTKGARYALHSQSVQALGQQLLANVATTHALRQQERRAGCEPTAQYPHRTTAFHTVRWKDQAVRVRSGMLVLPNGRHQRELVLPLPARYQQRTIRAVELLWRADHYELALTVEEAAPPPLRPEGQTAGVDLGEVAIAALVTQRGASLVLNGRYLRSCKRLRNKRHSTLDAKLARCRNGSRRWRRLKRRKAQASAKLYRQQRHILHSASARLVQFAAAEGVRRLVVGDVRDIATRPRKGSKTNQKLTQWAHGQLVRYLSYKGQRQGMVVEQIDEAYSTRTCSQCGYVHPVARRRRVLRCTQPGCGALVQRDVNGAANICSRAVYGQDARVHAQAITYRHACAVAPRTRARKRSAALAVAARR
ncbi:MAG TPA: transposase [Roseiflexaceae bacterium]|nr:transposase [Roseiflexaceae bacterium]